MYYRLAELAGYFLRLGATAFGGPAAHVALMEEDCVRRRGWISREHFLDVLGAANLIPSQAARRFDAVPVGIEDGRLLVAMTDPSNVLALDDMKLLKEVTVHG